MEKMALLQNYIHLLQIKYLSKGTDTPHCTVGTGGTSSTVDIALYKLPALYKNGNIIPLPALLCLGYYIY